MNNEHFVNLFLGSQRRTQDFRTGGVLTFPEQSLHDYPPPPHFYRAPLYLVEKGSYYYLILMLIGKSGRQL